MFETDDQTFRDLEIFDDSNRTDVASIFDETVSKGGQRCLFNMLEKPLTDIRLLRERVEILQYLTKYPDFIDIDRNKLAFIEIYLEQEDGCNDFSVYGLWFRALKNRLKPDSSWDVAYRGVEMLGGLLFSLNRWMQEGVTDYAPKAMLQYRDRVGKLIGQSELKYIFTVTKLTVPAFGKLNYIFCQQEKEKVYELLNIIYEIEALASVAGVAARRGFVYPEYTEEEACIDIKGLYHPFLSQPVKNDFCLTRQRHMCFLTGPNMAGKSTCMKALGIAVLLAHTGFPVAAEEMRISVFQGMFTTINLSDDISRGYSHYYSEVQRVKFVAEKIAELKNIVVIFDELFRGTNVKDAYDASRAVISAFAGLSRSMFVISTHILEVAADLEKKERIDFRYFEIENREGKFHYTYQLKPGVSDERIGMYILACEKVVETILSAEQQD